MLFNRLPEMVDLLYNEQQSFIGTYLYKPFSYGIVILSPRDLGLDSVLESADTLTEKVAPAISPVMTTLVSVSAAVTEPFCLPSICW